MHDEPHAESTTARAGRSETDLPGRQLFVVDDEPMVRHAIAEVVADDFVAVRQASDGLEALDLASREQADVVVLDPTMPGMGGVETYSRLRALPGWREVPILMLTAHQGDGRLCAAYAARASDYLVKPFTIGQLRARLRTLALRSRR